LDINILPRFPVHEFIHHNSWFWNVCPRSIAA
jgi:hypothetical protein